MKNIFAFFILFFLMINPCLPQNNNDLRWTKIPATSPAINPAGDYSELPQYEPNYSAPKEPRKSVINNVAYTVGPNFRVHPRLSGTQSETPIARNSSNSYIMFGSANTFEGGNFSTGNYITTNGGSSWYGNDTLGNTIYNFGDPAPVIDKNGIMIISYIHAPTFLMATSHSNNNGLTWSNQNFIPTSSTNTDKNMSVTDLSPASSHYGRTYVVYTEFNGPYALRIVISYTDNGGLNWSNASPVSPPPDPGHYNLGADIALDTAGTVYVVWGNNIINGGNSTEDYMGFAKSFTGGATWAVSTNTAVDMNGLRTDNLLNGIRCNGFPRIDIDKSICNSRCGWIYVVTGEKYFYPAVGAADIVATVSTDNGITWTRSKVNQNTDPDNLEYLPAVRVDETGDVNICYYSTRNSPTNTDAEVYLTRSSDGCNTFTDIKVSDHSFIPAPIPGTASGYQGDYIGITAGNGKVWPYWCENGITGRYQAWTAYVNITGRVNCPITLDVLNVNNFTVYFPPYYWQILDARGYINMKQTGFSEDAYWFRSSVSAYGIDTGCAVFKSFTAPSGVNQSMQTFDFDPVGENVFISFDEAYAPNSNAELGPDSLILESSSDQGITFNPIANLYGSYSGGTLNTAPATQFSFTPAPAEWAHKSFPVPPYTNKLQFRAVSGNGNNIYLDNINIQDLINPVAGNVKIISQGYYNAAGNVMNAPDSVKVYLRNSSPPFNSVDSSVSVIEPVTFNATVFFPNAASGNYYLKIVQRNCIETWSKAGGESYIRGSVFNYDFTSSSSNTYANNIRQIDNTPVRYGMFSGDVIRNGFIDLNDLVFISNNSAAFVTGYVVTDLNGDLITNLSDMLIAYNNSATFAHIIAP